MNAVFTRSFKKSERFKIFMVGRSKFVMTAQLWVSGVTKIFHYGLAEWPSGAWLILTPQSSKQLRTTLLARTGLIKCIINLRAKRRHEKIQKEKDRSRSPLAVSTTQKVHLVTFRQSVARTTLIKDDFPSTSISFPLSVDVNYLLCKGLAPLSKLPVLRQIMCSLPFLVESHLHEESQIWVYRYWHRECRNTAKVGNLGRPQFMVDSQRTKVWCHCKSFILQMI